MTHFGTEGNPRAFSYTELSRLHMPLVCFQCGRPLNCFSDTFDYLSKRIDRADRLKGRQQTVLTDVQKRGKPCTAEEALFLAESTVVTVAGGDRVLGSVDDVLRYLGLTMPCCRTAMFTAAIDHRLLPPAPPTFMPFARLQMSSKLDAEPFTVECDGNTDKVDEPLLPVAVLQALSRQWRERALAATTRSPTASFECYHV